MNQVQLLGRLVRDPERKSQEAPATFTVAVDRLPDKNGERSADFIRCKAFGKTGDTLMKYWKKGKPIAVEGRIQTGSYQKQDGTTVYTTDILVNRIEFVPADKQQTAEEYPDPRRVNAEIDGIQRAGKAARQESFDDFEALDEEVPF